MTTTNEQHEEEARGGKPLVFYLEVLRQNHGSRAMTQEDVAAISGIPRKRLGRLERARELPQVIEDLIAVNGHLQGHGIIGKYAEQHEFWCCSDPGS